MGNKASKMNERYGNYEKSFDRLEKDTQRVKVRRGGWAQPLQQHSQLINPLVRCHADPADCARA